jgi:thiol-disulfide isomerase/thioredoxin
MENVTEEQVKQLQSEGKKLLVQYTAMWCGPCKALTPRLTTLSSNYPDITFVKVDVDENMDEIGELEIRSVPTIMIYNGDILINRSTGANIDSVYTKILDTL